MTGNKSTRRKKKLALGKSPAKGQRKNQEVEAGSPKGSSSKFVSDLLIRNEAAERSRDGKVPLNATHVIERKGPDGSVQVKRVRLKLY